MVIVRRQRDLNFFGKTRHKKVFAQKCNEKVVQLLSQLLSQILANADQPQSDRNRLKTQGNEKKFTKN